MRGRLILFISIIQSILFLGHFFLYATWAAFWGDFATSLPAKAAVAALSISFVTASLLGWYFHHPVVRLYYVLAAIWLGLFSYLLLAAALYWVAWSFSRLAGIGWAAGHAGNVLFGAAVLAAIYGIVNAAWLQVSRITVQLPNLPPHWRGRTAALVSDTHLGHIRNGRFVRRVARKVAALNPDLVFLAGDVYDGTAADFERLAQPWEEFIARANQEFRRGGAETRRKAEGEERFVRSKLRGSTAVLENDCFLGVYYVLGNHEEFYSHAEYMPPMVRAGVRFLNNEKVELDGLQLIGVHYRDAIEAESYRKVLRHLDIDRSRPSILLLHAPVRLVIAEEEGISLQLSGHTHGGQFFPYTWMAKRVWGEFIHGLQRLGNLQVFISYGAGTWGPPMRVGTRPEIVLIEFA